MATETGMNLDQLQAARNTNSDLYIAGVIERIIWETNAFQIDKAISLILTARPDYKTSDVFSHGRVRHPMTDPTHIPDPGLAREYAAYDRRHAS